MRKWRQAATVWLKMTAQIDLSQFNDPIWRINNLYTIVDKHGKAVPFKPWDEQQEFLENIHSRNLILKCRQRGFTTLMCIVQLDDCIFTPNTRAAVIAHKLDDAKVIFRDKVKFPFDNLPDQLKNAVATVQDKADALTLGNNSSFQVSTSARSGTLNWLHISEYGKICAQFPEKAREIRTGSFPAAENGVITIESTAEGEGGDFYDKCIQAQEKAGRGVELSKKDFKFFFYPWWRAKEYKLNFSTNPASPDDEQYFDSVENECGTVLTKEQRNWWMAQEKDLGGDMKREYPATPKEAFEQAIEGAIFADHIATAYKHRRIDTFPIDTTRPVNTFWDLGYFDETAIWLEQDHGQRPTFIGYYENSGEGIEHYIQWLKQWAAEHNVTFGRHYLPHDGDRKTIWTPEGTLTVMGRLGFQPIIVTRTPDKVESVKKAQRKFSVCAFDEDLCKEGLSRLKAYRKEWDERRSVWRATPHHGPESNGADAFRTFAEAPHTPQAPTVKHDRYTRSRYEDNEAGSGWAV